MIYIENVSKYQGTKKVLDNISMSVERDSIQVVLGPSGCGKTSLLRLIAGFEKPSSGKIEINGQIVSSIHGMISPNQRHLGMVFQDLALWPHMTVFSNVAFGLIGKNISRAKIHQKVDEALRNVSLLDRKNHFPRYLSGGEKQRLALARALITEPLYLLMDEPLGSLDPILKQSMIELLTTLRKKLSVGIIYVTHDLKEALSLADRIFLMYQGNILRIANKDFFCRFSTEELLAWYTEAL